MSGGGQAGGPACPDSFRFKAAGADLIREPQHLHRTRHETFLHGEPHALRFVIVAACARR